MPKKLLISFSGGRTSAFMTQWLLKHYKAVWNKAKGWFDGVDPKTGEVVEIIVVFANTGKEREETLDFVHQCDHRFGLHLVWVEAVVSKKYRQGVRAKVVDFLSASRSGEPFEAIIQKFGLPNQNTSFCSRDLKGETIKAYLRSVGFTKFWTALGIRDDERQRINFETARKNRILYPLVTMLPSTKSDVNLWWSRQPFELGVHIPKELFDGKERVFYRANHWRTGYWYAKPSNENRLDTDDCYWFQLKSYEGNCDLCWKKAERKLMTTSKENQHLTDWWETMEVKYENVLGEGQKDNPNIQLPMRIFRNRQSIRDIRAKAELPFALSEDESQDVDRWKQITFFEMVEAFDPELDLQDDGCAESCEAFQFS